MKIYELLFKVRTETGYEQLKDFVATLPDSIAPLYSAELSDDELLADDTPFPLFDEDSPSFYNLGDANIDARTQYINTRPFPFFWLKVVFVTSTRDEVQSLRYFLRDLNREVRLQLERMDTDETVEIARLNTNFEDPEAVDMDFPFFVPN